MADKKEVSTVSLDVGLKEVFKGYGGWFLPTVCVGGNQTINKG